jgi:hypothetical protein
MHANVLASLPKSCSQPQCRALAAYSDARILTTNYSWKFFSSCKHLNILARGVFLKNYFYILDDDDGMCSLLCHLP